MSAADLVLDDPGLKGQFAKLPPAQQALINWRLKWLQQAHKHQIEPAGDWWTIWLMLAGRGSGKTRAAAETLAAWAVDRPRTRWLVSAPTSGDIRGTCFEGDSGLLEIIPAGLIADYNKSLHEIKLINGSFIKGIPASEPERFRGGQWHGAWCCIAGTQILTPNGQKKIEDIRVGEMVQTRHGPRKVLAAGISGNLNELASIELGATRLTLTTDHPILIGGRWVAAGDVKIGDQAWVTERSAGDRSSGFSGTAASGATPSQSSAPIVTAATVTSVERLPNTTTYNLAVEGEHEFIANGVVVHNCDELAAWEYLQDSWDMIQFAVRLGHKTKIIASTTPKPKPLIVDLLGREGDDVVVTRASTYVNVSNLAPSFQKQILQYEGTNLGRQEIHAEIIDPEEGGIVKRDWFRLWPDGKPFPRLEYIIQSYDCATSDKTFNDPTGCITLGVFKPMDGGMSALILDCWQDHLQYPDLRPKVIDEYETVYGEGKARKLVDLILVEDKSAGISLIQDLHRAHLPVHAYNPGRADKVQRLSIVANIIRAGRVWVPESGKRPGFVRDWAEGMVSQICSFPEGTTHDEFVDCMSQGLRYLRDAGWISIDGPPREEVEQEDITDAEIYNMKGRENPYSA